MAAGDSVEVCGNWEFIIIYEFCRDRLRSLSIRLLLFDPRRERVTVLGIILSLLDLVLVQDVHALEGRLCCDFGLRRSGGDLLRRLKRRFPV